MENIWGYNTNSDNNNNDNNDNSLFSENCENEVYLDISIEEDDKNKTPRDKGISSRLVNEDFLSDEFEWNDELLDSVFEVNSNNLKIREKDYPQITTSSSQVSSNPEIKSSSFKKRTTKSKKVTPTSESLEATNNAKGKSNKQKSENKEASVEQRAYWRNARREFLRRKLIVSEDDERRQYLMLFAHYFNSHQINKLHQHISHYAESEGAVFRQNLHQLKEDGKLIFFFMPKTMEIRGVATYIKYARTIAYCAPDMTTHFSNVVIRNRLDGSVIMADVVLEGTPTFHILVKNIFKSALTPSSDKEEEIERKRQKVEIDDPLVDEVVISDLSSSLEKVQIVENSSKSNNLDISQGPIRNPKDMSPYRGIGKVFIHFSKDKKVYLAEINITKIEKIGGVCPNTLSVNSQTPSIKNNKNSVYKWASNIGNNFTKFLQYKPPNPNREI